MISDEQRARVCAIARSYVGTPYHDMGMVKGGGVDCATLSICVYSDAGLIERFVPEFYSPQWFLHQRQERYLETVLRFADETDSPLPGDLVLYQVGHLFAHGAIINEPGWPHIIQAHKNSGKVRMALGDAADLDGRSRRRPEPRARRYFTVRDGQR